MFKKIFSLALILVTVLSPLSFATSSATCFDTDTVLMLHCNGADASTTITDSSTTGHTVTANADFQIDTAQSKFSGASCIADGTGDFASVPDNATWDFGSGDFTIDFWLRTPVTTLEGAFFSQVTISGNPDGVVQFYRVNASGKLFFYSSNVLGTPVANYEKSWTPVADTWYHFALVRSGASLTLFIDGVNQSWTETTAIGTLPDIVSTLRVGFDDINNKYINGWIDEFRAVKGTAIYAANFTPAVAEYTSTCSVMNLGSMIEF